MSRPLRLDIAGGINHVTARGNAREPIFLDDTDRHRWLETLEQTAARFSWFVLAYCQLGNHYHLLVETPQPTLSRGMRHLNGVYAQRFNRRHGRVGHVFQARFHAVLVERDEQLLAVAAYVPRNPVRAGLCTQPEEWAWSSYRATLGAEPPRFLTIDRLLGHFADRREHARALYRRRVEQADDPFLGLSRSVVLGSSEFREMSVNGLGPMDEVPRDQWRSNPPPLSEILSRPTAATVANAYSRHGYTMRAIADHVGVHYSTISRWIRVGEQGMRDCKT